MARIDTLDPNAPLGVQLRAPSGPVVLVNTFFVPEPAQEEFLAGWREQAAHMASCPGFVSTQLHRGTGGSRLLLNIAHWESTQALAAAHADPAFRQRSAALPEGVVAYPHVFEKLAVPGVCDGVPSGAGESR
jgi:heme-degrading monooxygenase HmoA